MQRGIIETILGAVVLTIAFVFGFYIWQSKEGHGQNYDYHINVSFERIDGLTNGADVKIGGVKIGYVHDITVDPEFFDVNLHMRLDSQYRIPADSSASITSDGLLSDKFIALKIGNSKDMIANQGTLDNSETVVAFEELIARALFLLSNDSR